MSGALSAAPAMAGCMRDETLAEGEWLRASVGFGVGFGTVIGRRTLGPMVISYRVAFDDGACHYVWRAQVQLVDRPTGPPALHCLAGGMS